MQGAKTWPAYPALSAPLTIMGVERRWFLLSAMLGLAMWNAINSLVTGGVIFVVLYGAGWFAWREDPNMVEILRASTRFKARYDPGKWADSPWYLLIRGQAMNVDQEVADYESGRSACRGNPLLGLAGGRENLPDPRRRAGECGATIARRAGRAISRTNGHSSESLAADAFRGRFPDAHLLLSVSSGPARFDPGELGEQSTVAAISQRRRRSFLSRRVQDIQTYIAWTHDPHLSSASKGRSNQAWWKSYLQNWLARRRNPHESVYLLTEIEAAATRFRQLVDASSRPGIGLDASRTARRQGRIRCLERAHQSARPTRQRLGGSNRQRHELAAGSQ